MTGYHATAYQTNDQNVNCRTLCICSHVTRRSALRQLILNLVAIGFLRNTQTNGNTCPAFAHELSQNIQSAEDVDTICMTYGKSGFNIPGGWSWHLYRSH